MTLNIELLDVRGATIRLEDVQTVIQASGKNPYKKRKSATNLIKSAHKNQVKDYCGNQTWRTLIVLKGGTLIRVSLSYDKTLAAWARFIRSRSRPNPRPQTRL